MSSVLIEATRRDPVGRALLAISRLAALLGGVLLCAGGVLTVVSVMGRYLFSSPIEGDFELVEAAVAIGVFSFLPYCQMVKGNVIVDFFTAKVRPGIRCLLDAVGALLFGAVAVLVCWRTTIGGMDFYETGEQTVILEINRYYSFYVIVPLLALLVLVCLYTAWRSLRQARGVLPDDAGAHEVM
jgi:TRAP-type C4-dicarboxylate transport system permease small subunit